jgi:hypothetical protein
MKLSTLAWDGHGRDCDTQACIANGMLHYMGLTCIQVRLDPAQYPGESGEFVWERSLHSGPHKDQLEIRRTGNKPCSAQVCINALDGKLGTPCTAAYMQLRPSATRHVLSLSCWLDSSTCVEVVSMLPAYHMWMCDQEFSAHSPALPPP